MQCERPRYARWKFRTCGEPRPTGGRGSFPRMDGGINVLVSRPVRPGEIRAIFMGMNTCTVGSYGNGWFKVTVLTPSGDIQIKDGFVSELAAEKWAAN
jgi:hypothetical protein